MSCIIYFNSASEQRRISLKIKNLKLREYQKEGSLFLQSHSRAALWDEAGTGKTCQVLDCVKKLGIKKWLVLCPAFLRANWHTESVMWWAPLPRVESFNYIQQHYKASRLGRFELVVVDEVHMLSKWTANQTVNFIREVAPKCQRIIYLSGTPSTQSAADLHAILSVMEPGRWGKFGEFKERYCYVRTVGYGKYQREIFEGWRKPSELREALLRVGLRRKKKDVAKELPPVTYVNLELDLSGKDFRIESEEEGEAEHIQTVMREIGVKKAQVLTEWIQDFRKPVVLWCWFRETIDFITNVVLLGREFGVIDGRVSANKKDKLVQSFQKGEFQFLICQALAGGVGLNFTRASDTVVIDFPYSAAVYDQMIARLDRIGQKSPVTVYNAYVPDSIDERILKILRRKSEGMRRSLDG